MKKHVDSFLYKIFYGFWSPNYYKCLDQMMIIWWNFGILGMPSKLKPCLECKFGRGVRGPGITCWLFTKWGGGKKITLTNPPYWLKYSKAKKCKFCWLPMIPSFPLDPNETNRQLYFVSSQVVSYSCLFVLFGSLFHFVFIV